MSTLAQIRDAVVAKLGSVPGIGIVHRYERYAAREGDFRALYVATIGGENLIRGWYVRRMRTREVSEVHGVSMRVTDWRIVGYHGLDDAGESEIVLDNLVEDACAAFRSDPTLGGVVASLRDLTSPDGDARYGLQVEDFAQVLLAQKLCHRAQLALITSNSLQF